MLLPKLAKNATANPMSMTHHMIMKNMMSKAAAAMISEYADSFFEKVKYYRILTKRRAILKVEIVAYISIC